MLPCPIWSPVNCSCGFLLTRSSIHPVQNPPMINSNKLWTRSSVSYPTRACVHWKTMVPPGQSMCLPWRSKPSCPRPHSTRSICRCHATAHYETCHGRQHELFGWEVAGNADLVLGDVAHFIGVGSPGYEQPPMITAE